MSRINRMISKYYVERLIDEQMNEFAIINRSFNVLRDSKVREVILDDVIETVLNDYKGELINQRDLFNLSNKIYNQLLINVND